VLSADCVSPTIYIIVPLAGWGKKVSLASGCVPTSSSQLSCLLEPPKKGQKGASMLRMMR
jgi:hypothetical protein